MSKKTAFLSLITALVIVALVVYVNTGEVRATDPFFNDQAKCLDEKSKELMDQHWQQKTTPPAVYFAPLPTNGDRILAPEVLTEYNIDMVTSFEALTQRLAQSPKPAAIYLHPAIVKQVDNAWLRQQYEASVAVVALNTLLSDLARKLRVEAPMADLRLEYARGRAYVALFHKATIPDGASGEVVVADFVESPEQIPDIIPQSTDTYHLTREYLDTVSNTCLK